MTTKYNTSDLRRELRSSENKKAELETLVQTLSTKIEEHERLSEISIEEYIESETEKEKEEIIRTNKIPKAKLEKEISELEDLISLKSTEEESEELIKAKERQAYLDKAAITLNSFKVALESASHSHFFWLGYNKKKINMSKYRKLYSVIEKRIDEVETWNDYVAKPFSSVENKEKEKGYNKINYLYSIVYSPYVLFNIIPAFFTTIRRVKLLHKYSQMYHTLMNNTIKLRLATSEQIEKLFSELIDIRQKSLNEQLMILKEKLDGLIDKEEQAIDSIEINTSLKVIELNNLLEKYKVDVEDNKETIRTLSERIIEIKALLDKIDSEYRDKLEIERDPYIRGMDSRSVVVPEKLLFDYSSGTNNFIKFNTGLYLFEDREDVFNLIRLVIFQIRNYMKWGTYHFRIHDLLSAVEVMDMLMKSESNNDISIYSLSEEKDQMVETLHDLYKRRIKQVMPVADNISEFNLIADTQDSSLLNYNFIFLYTEGKLTMNEQLIQLLTLGKKVGIFVMLFVHREQIDSKILIAHKAFIETTIELTDSGITQHDTKEFIEELKFEESDS